ncbi:winged helix DNA-binding domain-containing protein [Taibaiella soli]|uniref:Winged helix DNA-binding domain-containing protein n=1 Tax=Taibaiella soli TaxID=1649169 RepID=A0A2W2AB82_9BACT|nr:winged helix DNA-binding domain-containing protein [Taibaiella soli]PZF70862.1 winged helix DNA-binding domain-containing protein [Taibaiella soli]
MKTSDLIKFRLHNLHISQRVHETPAAIVSELGVVQAQDYAAAKWAIGSRLEGSTDADIEAALNNRSIVRTWALRGTLHIASAADVRWILQLASARMTSLYASHYHRLGLDATVMTKSIKLLTKAMEGGKQLTRKEIADLLEKKGIATGDMRLSFILLRASLNGIICFGARRNKEFTFTLLDEWIKPTPEKTQEEAMASLALKYFTSHGPATTQDFAWWSGLTLTQVKTTIGMIASTLEEITVDGQSYWMHSNLVSPKSASGTFLLAGFEEYLLAYADRNLILEKEHSPHAIGKNGLFNPTIITNGLITGVWRRSLEKDGLHVSVKSFHTYTETQKRAIATKAKSFAKFMEQPLIDVSY